METIFLLLSQSENSRLLFSFLSDKYQLQTRDRANPFESPVDLFIVDGPTLQQYQDQLKARITQENPLFLPVLFITNHQVINRVTGDIWQVVDDILMMPIEKRELLIRIETLLRSRRLSLKLKMSQEALCQSEQTIEQLEEELDNLSHLFKNKEVATTDCRETELN